MKVKQTEKHLNGGEERRRSWIKEEPRWVLCLKNTKPFIRYMVCRIFSLFVVRKFYISYPEYDPPIGFNIYTQLKVI